MVAAHLVYNEEVNWIPRATRILTAGESKTFDPFDRFAHLTRYGDWSVDALLDRFAELRRANLATLREWNLTQQQLASAGRHPDFGRVTLAQLLATWCVYGTTHFAQVLRVVAWQYDDAVGPWKQYLSLLHWK